MKSSRKLLKKFYSGQCSADELKEVYKLFNTPGLEAKINSYLENEWNGFDVKYYVYPKEFEKLYTKIKRSDGIAKKRSPRQLYFKIAATILLVATFGAIFLYYALPQYNNDYASTQTKRGERTTITFSDGSIVTLAADSKIRYPRNFTDENRNIYLTGEAFFTVSQNKKPLVVFANDISTTVSASSFNISAFPESDEVIVAVDQGEAYIQEGSKKPLTGKESFPATKLVLAKKKSIPMTRLQPAIKIESRQYLVYHKIDKKANVTEGLNTKNFFGWKDGIISFTDADSLEIMNKLERWYDVEIDIEGCFSNNQRYSGQFENEGLSDILSSMTVALNIDYKINGNKVLLKGVCN